MNDDTLVLGAMLRLARRGLEATVDELYERVGTDQARIRSALSRLDTAGYVERRKTGARLTMTGLAMSVALRPVAPRGRTAEVTVAVERRGKLRSHAA
jgi:DNA-binding IclR family transcriptional regulator